MYDEKEIGKKVRGLRGPLSLRDFGEKCGISHTTIDTIEKGVDFRTGKPAQAKIATIQKIADTCGVPISYIIGEEPASTTDELKIALFGGSENVTDEMLRKVLEYAAFIKSQRENN